MDLQICINRRRSIRNFNNIEVSDRIITQLVEAAIYAPSWKNTQVTRYYAVKNKAIKNQILTAVPEFNRNAVETAPVLIVSTTVKNRSGYDSEGNVDTPKGKGWQMFDCGLSNMIFTLKAAELGLGTVIMGIYDEEKLTRLLNIPENEEVVSLISLGYYDEAAVMPKRKAASEILKFI